MKTVIASIIRNEGKRLETFLQSCSSLEKINDVQYVFIVGSSIDNTFKIVKQFVDKRSNALLIKEESDNPIFKHNKSLERTKVFAKLRNTLLELSKQFNPDCVLMIDANILFNSQLITDLNKLTADIVAPLILYDLQTKAQYSKLDLTSMIFYDVWAFRKDGKNFNAAYPFYENINLKSDAPVYLDSVGACFLIKKNVLDAGITFNGDTDCEHVSFCKDAKDRGFSIALNASCCVYKQRRR